MGGPWTVDVDAVVLRFVHGPWFRGLEVCRKNHGQLNFQKTMDTFETSMDLQV